MEVRSNCCKTNTNGEIRKKIIEDDLIEGIIAMPMQLFYSVTIPVMLWFITKGKKQKGKTLFINARKMGHMVDCKRRDFFEEDIQKLAVELLLRNSLTHCAATELSTGRKEIVHERKCV